MNDILVANGDRRILNLQPSPAGNLVGIPAFGPTMPDSEVRAFDDWPAPLKIKDQDGAGACNGHATATVLEFARYHSGQPYVPMSAWWVYGCLVKGWDRGSNIIDALNLISDKGCAPESMVKYKDYSGRYSDDAKAAAMRYKLEIGAQLKTWEEVLTAVALRQSVNLSIRVGMGFNNLNSDGCPGVGRGPGNHAVMCGGGIKKSRRSGWLVRMANSWGSGWGLDGFCWLGRAHIEAGTWFEAFTVSAVIEDLADDDNPPPVSVAQDPERG